VASASCPCNVWVVSCCLPVVTAGRACCAGSSPQQHPAAYLTSPNGTRRNPRPPCTLSDQRRGLLRLRHGASRHWQSVRRSARGRAMGCRCGCRCECSCELLWPETASAAEACFFILCRRVTLCSACELPACRCGERREMSCGRGHTALRSWHQAVWLPQQIGEPSVGGGHTLASAPPWSTDRSIIAALLCRLHGRLLKRGG